MNSQRISTSQEEMVKIKEQFKTMAPRIHFYCKKSEEKDIVDHFHIVQDILNYYSTAIVRLITRLDSLKEDLNTTEFADLDKQLKNIKNKCDRHLTTIKRLMSTPTENNPPEIKQLEIERSTIESPKPAIATNNKHPNFFKRNTAAVATTTAAAIAIGYIFIKQ